MSFISPNEIQRTSHSTDYVGMPSLLREIDQKNFDYGTANAAEIRIKIEDWIRDIVTLRRDAFRSLDRIHPAFIIKASRRFHIGNAQHQSTKGEIESSFIASARDLCIERGKELRAMGVPDDTLPCLIGKVIKSAAIISGGFSITSEVEVDLLPRNLSIPILEGIGIPVDQGPLPKKDAITQLERHGRLGHAPGTTRGQG